MILNVVIDDQLLELEVPQAFIEQAQDFFAKMDADMDRGWQVDREWVERPERLLRAQIAANKLFTALENDNHKLGRLMAGYVLSRVPEVERVEINPAGETRDHRIVLREAAAGGTADDGLPGAAGLSHPGLPQGLSKMEAMAQASKDVSRVFKVGRHYRFSVYNHATGQWDDSAAIGDKDQAEAMREQAVKARFDALRS